MEVSTQAAGRLSVSIVLHNNSLALLRRLLLSLERAAATAREAGCIGAVVVDVLDNSSDLQHRRLTAADAPSWPHGDGFQICYRELPVNEGFAAGHNQAIRQRLSEFHLVLNPDTELAVDALRVGLSCLLADPGIVLLSPRVAAEDGSREFLCKRYPSLLVLLLRAFGPKPLRRLFRARLDAYEMRDACSGDDTAEVPLASGCFMLARMAALKAVAGFDESYFLYFEDFDLSLRLAGQGRLVFNPAMRIIHHGGYAASKGPQHVRYFARSAFTFFNRHGWRWI